MSDQEALLRKKYELQRKKKEVLERKARYEAKLPHIYFPLYEWQKQLIDSNNRVNLLTAANQIGKSSALIRRLITNATDKRRWMELWGEGVVPRQLWYFYPDTITLEKEIDTKWVPEWLPREEMERSPIYGWKLYKKNNTYNSLVFNSGVNVYFMTYSKQASMIQSSTVYEIFADEELPMQLYDELMFRLSATNGIFTSGFTPTLNQLYWKRAMETEPDKVLPNAYKRSVSMYDCLKYVDGSPSRIMTLEKIKNAEEKCQNDTERQRRIWGKFVTEEGRTFYAFDYTRNVKDPYGVKEWTIYASVDYGSGDDAGTAAKKYNKNHPAAIVYVAVRKDYKKGAVFRAWRGDGVKTTAGDVFEKYKDLSKDLVITQACYDPASKDFGLIAERNAVSFQKAKKDKDQGEDLLNTLFQHKMLDIFNDDPECLKLANELESLMLSRTSKGSKYGDDLADALRYCVMQVPWDLSAILDKTEEDPDKPKQARPMTEKEFQEIQIKLRRGEDVYGTTNSAADGWHEIEEDIQYWNDQYG